MRISLDKQDKMHYIDISNHYYYRFAMLTGFRGISGSHTLYNKGDQDYEEMGLYSLRLRL